VVRTASAQAISVATRPWLIRAAANVAVFGVLVAAIAGVGATTAYRHAFGGGTGIANPLPAIPSDRPLLVVVRGWLVDPESRRTTEPLFVFPATVDAAFAERGEPTPVIVNYEWSRVPRDLMASSAAFVSFARELTARAAAKGRCVDFVGHSAGALMVYLAASDGVPMGFMGTIGWPGVGSRKPPSVAVWDNFYSSATLGDLPGRLWGSRAGADANIDLTTTHADMWRSKDLARTAAAGIADAWSTCTPSSPSSIAP